MVSRRSLLVTGGASIAVLGLGYAGFQTLHSDLRPARRPWLEAGEGFDDDIRLAALSYAILAPSPHNRQPWLVALEGADALTLYCDLDRLLPHTDPPNRQIVIGLGAFVELMRQAAAAMGYRIEVEPFPQGEPQPVLDDRPVAHIRFVSEHAIAPDGLFSAVFDRRTVRLPFDQSRPVSSDVLSKIAGDSGAGSRFQYTNDRSHIADLKEICTRAWHVETKTPITHQETTALTRIGDDEINANPDGISLSGPFLETLNAIGVLSEEKLNDSHSKAFRGGVKFYNDAINSAMAFGWLSTPGNSRMDQLRAGADWVRLHLAVTQAGLAMHPLSQVLQEFPEMSALYQEFHHYVEIEEPSRVQGLFRFGYAKSPAPAPRWPMRSRIVTL